MPMHAPIKKYIIEAASQSNTISRFVMNDALMRDWGILYIMIEKYAIVPNISQNFSLIIVFIIEIGVS